MTPDAYMPFYHRDFFEAMKGHSDRVALGYLKAICHYWGHEHCRGLRDDESYLRRICEVDERDWDEFKVVVFDNDKFFTMGADGLWHQKRASDLWQSAQQNYTSRVKAATKAANARWGRKH